MNQHSRALQGLRSEQLWLGWRLGGDIWRGGCSHPTQDPVPNPPSTASSAPVAAALLPADTSKGSTTLSLASWAEEVQGPVGKGLTGVGGVSGAPPASPAPRTPGICHRSAGAYGAKTCQAEEPGKADEKAPSD